MKDVEEIWNIIEKYKNDQAKTQANANKNINKSQEDVDQKGDKDAENSKRKADNDNDVPKKKKKKNDEAEEQLINSEETQPSDESPSERFSFQAKILDILMEKGNISLRKLEKKVINAYLKYLQETQVTPKLVKKFNKKLKKIPNIEISDDRVSLIQNSED